MNARRTMYKLQTALCARGRPVRINQRQSWCEDSGRMITKYIIMTEGSRKPALETYKPIEIVQFLAGLLKHGGDEE